MKEPIIKVCGLKHAENIEAVAALGVDMLGFIFYPPSPRCVLPAGPPATETGRVGVFVDAPRAEMLEYARRFQLTGLQLHGKETPDSCRAMRGSYQVIKAFPIAEAADFQAVRDYEGCCDYFLFDTKGSRHGGNGVAFDWNLLETYQGDTPFFLSGGIAPADAVELARLQHPQLAGFDLNSRFESEPGLKRPELLLEFLQQLESAIERRA